MKHFFAIFIAIFFHLSLFAQVGIGTTTPDPSSILDISSTDKGLLIPRLTTQQRTDISNPVAGLMVFDSELNSFCYYNGNSWTVMDASANVFEYANNVVKPNATNGDVANDDFVFGSPQLGDVGNSDHDQRFFFDKSKGAFRAGDVNLDQWDDANVGDFSVAFGKDTQASGKGALAMGRNSIAAGDYSFAIGDAALANNIASVAIGNNASASGLYSIGFGYQANAASTASMALGYNTSSSGIGALAVGYQANATVDGAMAFGYNVTSNNIGAVALGYQSTANEFASVALGYNTIANGDASVAVGYENTAASAYETTIGLFATNYTPNSSSNYDATDRLFTIGNGTSDLNRSDAFMILKNGNTFINGSLTIDNNYTFPTTDGTIGQTMVTDGSGSLAWSSLTDNDNQSLSINGSNLTISNGNTLDISSVNTDAQALSISGNTLSLTNSVSVTLPSSYFEYNTANKIIKPNTANGDVANDDFVFGALQLANSGNADHYSRFFFDKSKSAFRAGFADNNAWDDASIGLYSAAFGNSTIASGNYSFAIGENTDAAGNYSFAGGAGTTASGINSAAFGNNTYASGNESVSFGSFSEANGNNSLAGGSDADASGQNSLAFGKNVFSYGNSSVALGAYNSADSYAETTLGLYATSYLPNSATAYHATDRLFTIGNGTATINRSDAFMILKNGNTFINGALTIDNNYTFPTTDGTIGQVLQTDGSGNLAWSSLTDNDNQDLSLSGNTLSLTNGGTTVDLTALSNSMVDADNNTKIQVEKSANEDVIRFDLGGSERLVLSKNSNGSSLMSFPNNNTSVFIGEDAGLNNNTGTSNSFIGYHAGKDNTSGKFNTYTGQGAGRQNTIGEHNAYYGMIAGSNSNGSNNSFFGSQAGGTFNTSVSNNSFFGTRSGFVHTTGNNNFFMGYESGGANSTGENNTFIGSLSGKDANGNGNVLIGYEVGFNGTANNKLYIDNSSTTSPLIYGEFDNNLLRINGTLNINNAFSFPTTDGTNGQVLQTDGSGGLTWSSLTDNNIFSNNGTLTGNREVTLNGSNLQFNTTGRKDAITISRGGSSGDAGIAFKNTLLYPAAIAAPQTGLGNNNGLDFYTKGIDTDLNNVGATMRLTNNGTIIFPEYGQGNVTGTVAEILAVTSSGNLIGTNFSAIKDADNDTKIQVEEGTNDNEIRFDINGEQEFRMYQNVSGIPLFSIGDDNTLIGGNTGGPMTTGTQNTFLGTDVGIGVQTGSDNTLIGYEAGRLSSGTNNTYIGSGAGKGNSGSSHNIFIGYQAGANETNSNRLYIDNNNTASPLIYGEFDNDLVRINGALDVTGALKSSSIETVGGDMTISAIGWGMNFEIDTDANSNDKYQWFSDNNEVMTLDGSGNLAIDGNLTENSDIRLKKNFQRIEQPLAKIEALNGYYYHWKNRIDTTQQVGVIAQEVEAVLPQLVTTDGDGFKAVEYTKLTALLIEGMKAQQQQIEDLKAENTTLKAQTAKINQFESMLLDLQAQVSEQQAEALNTVSSEKK